MSIDQQVKNWEDAVAALQASETLRHDLVASVRFVIGSRRPQRAWTDDDLLLMLKEAMSQPPLVI